MFFMGFGAFILLPSIDVFFLYFPFFQRVKLTVSFFSGPANGDSPTETFYAHVGYATSISFKLLSFFGFDGDVLRDIP